MFFSSTLLTCVWCAEYYTEQERYAVAQGAQVTDSPTQPEATSTQAPATPIAAPPAAEPHQDAKLRPGLGPSHSTLSPEPHSPSPPSPHPAMVSADAVIEESQGEGMAASAGGCKGCMQQGGKEKEEEEEEEGEIQPLGRSHRWIMSPHDYYCGSMETLMSRVPL